MRMLFTVLLLLFAMAAHAQDQGFFTSVYEKSTGDTSWQMEEKVQFFFKGHRRLVISSHMEHGALKQAKSLLNDSDSTFISMMIVNGSKMGVRTRLPAEKPDKEDINTKIQLTDSFRTIEGHRCRKLVATNGKTLTLYWVTEEIRPSPLMLDCVLEENPRNSVIGRKLLELHALPLLILDSALHQQRITGLSLEKIPDDIFSTEGYIISDLTR